MFPWRGIGSDKILSVWPVSVESFMINGTNAVDSKMKVIGDQPIPDVCNLLI